MENRQFGVCPICGRPMMHSRLNGYQCLYRDDNTHQAALRRPSQQKPVGPTQKKAGDSERH